MEATLVATIKLRPNNTRFLCGRDFLCRSRLLCKAGGQGRLVP